jgi:hypothetical protein
VHKVLQKGDRISAWQDMGKPFPKRSDPCFGGVQQLPQNLNNPVLPTTLKNGQVPALLWGNTAIDVCQLWVGALVDIYSIDSQLYGLNKELYKERVGGGVANALCNIFPLGKPLQRDTIYFARQSLCAVHKDSNPVIPSEQISSPVICQPLCQGDTQVTVNYTQPNSSVTIRVTSQGQQTLSNATAPDLITVVPTGEGVALKTGDTVAVRQSNIYLDSGWTSPEAPVITKEACDHWKRLEPWPHCDRSFESPIPVCNNCTPPPTTTPTCPGEGNPCKTHPQECSGRGPEWLIQGKFVCQGGKPVCQAKPYTDYCIYGDGAGCGDAWGSSCNPNASTCVPGTICRLLDPINNPGYYGCAAIGVGCTPVQGLCWTKDEVGKPQLGCVEGQP